MKKLIKSFKMHPSGAYEYVLNRSVRTAAEVQQLDKEEGELYLKHKENVSKT